MTLQEMLDCIVERAQAEVKCRKCNGTGGALARLPEYMGECEPCHGAGEVPDPRFATLAEVLTEKCLRCDGRGRLRDDWPNLCGRCSGSGRVLRLDWPQGALAGTLLLWCNSQPQTVLIQQLGKELEYCFNLRAPYCDDRATERVLEYMEKAKEATHATE